MKKVNWNSLGGHPLLKDNFKHMQDGYTEAIEQMLRAYPIDPAENYKLRGAEVTISNNGNTADVTAGWIVLDGEVCQVDVQSGITKTLGDSFFWNKVTTQLAIDPQNYLNGSVVKVHNITKAFLDSGPILSGQPDYQIKTLQDVIYDQLELDTEWIVIGSTGAPGFQQNWKPIANTVQPAFRKVMRNKVELRGVVAGNDSTFSIIFVLPVGYRPAEEIIGGISSNSSDKSYEYRVLVNGTVFINQPPLEDNTYNLANIPPFYV